MKHTTIKRSVLVLGVVVLAIFALSRSTPGANSLTQGLLALNPVVSAQEGGEGAEGAEGAEGSEGSSGGAASGDAASSGDSGAASCSAAAAASSGDASSGATSGGCPSGSSSGDSGTGSGTGTGGDSGSTAADAGGGGGGCVASYGSSCTSAVNACNQSSSGTIDCNGVCSAQTPSCSGSCDMSGINGCTTGTLGANAQQSDGSYHWYCDGSNGGATSGLCWYVPPASPSSVTGSCASDPVPAGGSGNYPVNGCASGTLGANAAQPNGNYHWYCNGSNGGAESGLCWYVPPAPSSSVAGSCATNPPPSGGSGNYPVNGCSSGSLGANSAQSDGSYHWYCNGDPNTPANESSLCWYAPPSNAPTVSLSASPMSVDSGSHSTLSWSSTNATSCTPGGPWSNSGSLSGSGWTDPLTSDTTFTLQCSGPGGTSPVASVTVGVIAADGSCPATTINNCMLPATPSGGNAGSCTWGYAGACNFTCTRGIWNQNSNSCAAGSSTVTASLTASPATINVGQFSTLTWSSTGATSCSSAGGFSTGGATSGSTKVSPATTSTYLITCTGAGGTSARANATVTVITPPPPSLSISAAPQRVRSGQSSTITWSASSVTDCSITRNGIVWKSGPANASNVYAGSTPDPITSQTRYVLSCTDFSGAPWSVKASVVVNVAADFQEF